MNVSYVLLAYGNWSYTERCLRSLQACGLPRAGEELIVVDNGSLDETPEALRAWGHVARIVTLARNRNFAGGINTGIRAARGDVLVLLNNDLEIPAGALDALVEEASRPDVGIVGTRLLYPNGRIQHGGFGWRDADILSTLHFFHHANGDLPAARAVVDLDAVTGACIAARRSVLEELDGFDEGFVNGWEDIDLCLRARAAGYRVVYRGDVHVVHHESVTAGTSWNADANVALLRERWGGREFGDGPRVEALYGGVLSPVPAGSVGAESPAGALIELRGTFATFGPAADQARAVLELLEAMGLQPRACDTSAAIPAPELGDALRGLLARAADRSRRRNALSVAAEDLPSPMRAYGVGPGGGGVLAVLPAHDFALCREIVELVDGLDVPVSLLPTVADSRLPAGMLPAADTEAELARHAAGADVVVAFDPEDVLQRRALTAAAAGAAVVAARGGQAERVLGDLLHDTVASALADTTPREERAARVLLACGYGAVAAQLPGLLAAAFAS